MRRAYEQTIEQVFAKLMAHQRDFVQAETFRFSDIKDRTLSRFRSGPANMGAQQLINVADISDYAVVGATGGSTVVGA